MPDAVSKRLCRLTSAPVARTGKKISDQTVNLTGEGVYDIKARRMRSVLIVGSGTLLWQGNQAQPVTFHPLPN